MASGYLDPGSLKSQIWMLPLYICKHVTVVFSLIHILLKDFIKFVFKRKYRKRAFKLHYLPYTVKGACCGKGSSEVPLTGDTCHWSRVPPKSGFLLPPYSAYPMSLLWMEPVLVWTGSPAKTLFHQASAPMTGHRAPKKYLTPVSGSSLLSQGPGTMRKVSNWPL